MSFKARYDDHCHAEECRYGGRIQQGDECRYLDDELMHAACAYDESSPGETDNDDGNRDGPLCASCFTYHRGECA